MLDALYAGYAVQRAIREWQRLVHVRLMEFGAFNIPVIYHIRGDNIVTKLCKSPSKCATSAGHIHDRRANAPLPLGTSMTRPVGAISCKTSTTLLCVFLPAFSNRASPLPILRFHHLPSVQIAYCIPQHLH
jgi:hypothetical protein